MRLDTEKLQQKRREYTSRVSLTLLFAGAAFLIILVVLVVVGTLALILVNTGVLTKKDIGLISANQLIAFILLDSFVAGAAGALLFGRLYMRPISAMLNMMNRLAAGDFHSRIRFSGLFARHPAVVELTGSINTLAEELENTELLRSDFINNFSHEFKTPIVSIAGFATLLKSAELSEEQRAEYIGIIAEESRRLSAMATNVLNLTKVENQTILSDVTVFNLSEQIRTCLLLLENKWADKGLDLCLEFREYRIAGNEELLRQVWINLLDNAVKFTPFGGTIRVDIARQGDRLQVTVANTGSTVLPEDRERIFRKFYQGDTSHATEGNGVGLAVGKRIVELHGGQVWVESAEDMTRFTVCLPAGVAQTA